MDDGMMDDAALLGRHFPRLGVLGELAPVAPAGRNLRFPTSVETQRALRFAKSAMTF